MTRSRIIPTPVELTIRVSEELVGRLRARALEEDRTMASLVRVALRAYLDGAEPTPERLPFRAVEAGTQWAVEGPAGYRSRHRTLKSASARADALNTDWLREELERRGARA